MALFQNVPYFYNANHSPFFSSDESNNPSPDDFSKDANFETYHNNRSTRLMNLIEAEDKVSYADFKRIKYDHQLPKPFVVGAGTYLMLYHKLRPYYDQIPDPKIIPTAILVKAFKEVKAHMLKHFGTTKVALGDYQKLVRGNKELPVFGMNDVVTAMSAVPYKDGKVKVVAGESYIELVKFTSEGYQISWLRYRPCLSCFLTFVRH